MIVGIDVSCILLYCFCVMFWIDDSIILSCVICLCVIGRNWWLIFVSVMLWVVCWNNLILSVCLSFWMWCDSFGWVRFSFFVV